jgi:hypothetical protein
LSPPANASRVSGDRFQLWLAAAGFVAAHVVYWLAEGQAGSPAAAILFLLVGGPALLFVVVACLTTALKAKQSGRWRRALSWSVGPVAGAALVIAMTAAGLPPWRVQFEVMRPYYLAKVWATPADGDRKRVVFTHYNKELWNGRETMLFVYDSAQPDKPIEPASCAGDTWTNQTDLGFGFHSELTVQSYGTSCP